MSKNLDINSAEGQKGGKMCEDKNALKSSMNTSSNEMNIDKVKELGISFNNINENTPDYDYNINNNLFNIFSEDGLFGRRI